MVAIRAHRAALRPEFVVLKEEKNQIKITSSAKVNKQEHIDSNECYKNQLSVFFLNSFYISELAMATSAERLRNDNDDDNDDHPRRPSHTGGHLRMDSNYYDILTVYYMVWVIACRLKEQRIV